MLLAYNIGPCHEVATWCSETTDQRLDIRGCTALASEGIGTLIMFVSRQALHIECMPLGIFSLPCLYNPVFYCSLCFHTYLCELGLVHLAVNGATLGDERKMRSSDWFYTKLSTSISEVLWQQVH